jgi:hypothetical protein
MQSAYVLLVQNCRVSSKQRSKKYHTFEIVMHDRKLVATKLREVVQQVCVPRVGLTPTSEGRRKAAFVCVLAGKLR